MSASFALQAAALAAGAWLLLINTIAFRAFGEDKRRAVHRQGRVSEAALLKLVAAGGGAGALAAMGLFRHKTRKQPFRTRLQLILAAQAIAAVCLAIWIAGRG